jgi:hypothetical protein
MSPLPTSCNRSTLPRWRASATTEKIADGRPRAADADADHNRAEAHRPL